MLATHPIWSAPLFEAMALNGSVAIPTLDLSLTFADGALCGATGPILGSDHLLADIHRDVSSGRSFDSVMDQIRDRLRQMLRQLLASPNPTVELADADETPAMPLPVFLDRLFDEVLAQERTATIVASSYAGRLQCKVVLRKPSVGVDAMGLRTLRLISETDSLRQLALASGRGTPRRTAAFWRSFDRMAYRGIVSVEGDAGAREKLVSGLVPHPKPTPRTPSTVAALHTEPAAATPVSSARDHGAWGSEVPMVTLELPSHMQSPRVAPAAPCADPEDEVLALGEDDDDDEYCRFDDYDEADCDEGDDPFGLHAALQARRSGRYPSTFNEVSNFG